MTIFSARNLNFRSFQYIPRRKTYACGTADMTITVKAQVVEGERVANHIAMCGTQEGNFQGIPPTGKAVAITGTNIMRFENGRIAELWGFLDAVGMMQGTHLGPLSPIPASSKAVTLTAISLFRFAEGKIIEDKVRADMVGCCSRLALFLPLLCKIPQIPFPLRNTTASF